MKKLQDKIALVTGASRGIGKSAAVHLATEGAFVIVHYANQREAALKTVEEIEAFGGKAIALKADFSSLENITALFKEIDQLLKGKKLDILINNAGILNKFGLEEITETQFDEQFAVNVKSPFFITQQAISRLNDGGRIINISSYLSKKPKYEYGAYSMTKAAIDNFTLSLATALGPRKITVNAIAPGSIDTDMNKERFKDIEVREAVSKMTAFQRVGKPDDISKVIVFLASEAGEWITGQYIEASGGLGLV
ncbi:SDR family oxidoreductase [Leptobacterium flavescens]|uniref:SDR family oxidoreductase n=1 Tax=Leptobacterium flavescens TaxID=472055 RepID=A0A6P0UNG6_9FLAO|nr:SDR family oxidoreductase [Leptobacterium flavescens]NER14715.1 SDR family oxidoreductase [Leptobacterium flavescens]